MRQEKSSTTPVQKIATRLWMWRLRYINNKNFLLIVSGLVGLVAGVTAIVLKTLVRFIEDLLFHSTAAEQYNWLYLFFPLAGILLTVVYVQRFRGGKLGRGISNIIYAVNRKGGDVEPDKTYSHVITSALTVGSGGSCGLEAPIVVTGSAIGSNVAKALRFTVKERTLLLASGAAAGISAVFNAPLGGVIFALEVLLPEFTIPAFIPLLIASATAAVVSSISESGQLFFLVTEGWEAAAIPYYVLLALCCGLISVYMIRMSLKLEGYLKHHPSKYRKAIFGGIGLSLMIFFVPVLYGEGYSSINNLLNGNYLLIFNNTPVYAFRDIPGMVVLLGVGVIFLKVIATALTVGSGGNGGIFAPSLFTGAFTGFVFAFGINMTQIQELNLSNFAVAGMAGILSGVVHAPLTAIFLIAEATAGYKLFVPLMIVSAMSFFITRYFEPFSIYTKKLAARGHLSTKDKDENLLEMMSVERLLEKDFKTVYLTTTLGELIDVIASCKRNIFPVINDKQELIGVVYLDNIREIMFNTSRYDNTQVKDFYLPATHRLDIHTPMQQVMEIFEKSKVWNLPVLQNGQYVGFISKSNIFNEYRKLLIKKGKSEEIPI